MTFCQIYIFTSYKRTCNKRTNTI